MNRKHLATVLLTCFVACDATFSDQSHAQSIKRDLTLYEKKGPYEIKPLATDADLIRGKIREFLWQHWHEHRRGHLIVTSLSKEGEPSIASYFIEPDEHDKWGIVVKIDRVRHDRRPISNPAHVSKKISETVEYAAYFVDRIEIPRDGLTSRKAIPMEKARSPHSYRLRLKDKNKKVLVEL